MYERVYTKECSIVLFHFEAAYVSISISMEPVLRPCLGPHLFPQAAMSKHDAWDT